MIRKCDAGLVTGKVTETDHRATGELMRKNRESIGLSLRDMASRMEISAPYLSDLEIGNRNWSQKLMDLWWESASQE